MVTHSRGRGSARLGLTALDDRLVPTTLAPVVAPIGPVALVAPPTAPSLPPAAVADVTIRLPADPAAPKTTFQLVSVQTRADGRVTFSGTAAQGSVVHLLPTHWREISAYNQWMLSWRADYATSAPNWPTDWPKLMPAWVLGTATADASGQWSITVNVSAVGTGTRTFGFLNFVGNTATIREATATVTPVPIMPLTPGGIIWLLPKSAAGSLTVATP